MNKKEFDKKVEETKKELSNKSYSEIQEAAAYSWAARACASYKNILKANKSNKLELYILGQEYAHEALEHAALVSSKPEVTQNVTEYISMYEVLAWKELRNIK